MKKDKLCPFCGSDEISWLNHKEKCYLRMMAEEENEKYKYSIMEFLDAWNTRFEEK